MSRPVSDTTPRRWLPIRNDWTSHPGIQGPSSKALKKITSRACDRNCDPAQVPIWAKLFFCHISFSGNETLQALCVFASFNWQISVPLPTVWGFCLRKGNYSLEYSAKDQTGFRVWSVETRLCSLTNQSANLRKIPIQGLAQPQIFFFHFGAVFFFLFVSAQISILNGLLSFSYRQT